jgi:predicted DNA-binding transcriptional regulator AlpA
MTTAETFLRIRDVQRVTGLPPSSIYEWVSKDRFPKQVRLSNWLPAASLTVIKCAIAWSMPAIAIG